MVSSPTPVLEGTEIGSKGGTSCCSSWLSVSEGGVGEGVGTGGSRPSLKSWKIWPMPGMLSISWGLTWFRPKAPATTTAQQAAKAAQVRSTRWWMGRAFTGNSSGREAKADCTAWK